MSCFYFLLLLIFGDTRVWIHGFMLTRQVLYDFSYTPTFSCFSYMSAFFYPWLPLDHDPPIYASHMGLQKCSSMPSLFAEMGSH
jgi:hypothetical protein